ncbi:MAG: 3-phosphoglycerate dehydrogenase, partial [Anaerotignum sp.]|nr:3-phosphoglycerate dehydrogenase [Anaerotignum sp.]
MYTIKTLNNIAATGLARLPEENFVVDNNAEDPHGIILRSFDMHNMELNENLLAVARAGAGTNNIPIDKCTEMGVPVFNTPGANANAVKELVLLGLFASSRRIIAGANWVQTIHGNVSNIEKAVEAGKKEFQGPEIAGKTLGVIGLGAIGVLVANAALDLGMDVIGYDPFLSLENAWHLSPSVELEESIEDVVAKADYITLHIPLNDKTKHTFNEKLFSVTKPGARLLNFARGGLVDNEALKKAIADGIIARYMTDFPSDDLMGDPWNIIATPHIGASTPESEENCAIMAAQELRDYL